MILSFDRKLIAKRWLSREHYNLRLTKWNLRWSEQLKKDGKTIRGYGSVSVSNTELVNENAVPNYTDRQHSWNVFLQYVDDRCLCRGSRLWRVTSRHAIHVNAAFRKYLSRIKLVILMQRPPVHSGINLYFTALCRKIETLSEVSLCILRLRCFAFTKWRIQVPKRSADICISVCSTRVVYVFKLTHCKTH